MMVHSGEKPHQCTQCVKSFKETHDGTQRGETTPVHTVCKVIQGQIQSKETHDGTQYGETTQVHTVCKNIQSSILSKDAHDGTQHRGETTQVQNMHLLKHYCWWYQETPN